MDSLTLTCLYKDGKFVNEGVRRRIIDEFKALEGKIITLTLGEMKLKRSSNQNRFWFGVCIPIIRQWLESYGYNFDAEETHEYMVRKVWKHTEVAFVDSEPYERRLSSTKLEKMEWEQKIDLTRQWGAERGLIIPFPNEFYEEVA